MKPSGPATLLISSLIEKMLTIAGTVNVFV
jgi:hypothetical protein